jgi:hypothetical protein
VNEGERQVALLMKKPPALTSTVVVDSSEPAGFPCVGEWTFWVSQLSPSSCALHCAVTPVHASVPL